MDQKNYEQTHIDAKAIGDRINFLKENMNASILFWNGRAITIDLPNSVELRVTKCDPGIRGDTVGGSYKPATLETGAEFNVPLFVNEGDVIKVDTRSHEYVGRVDS